MSWVCPVCHYPNLDDDPLLRNFNICPGCGVEFGYEDSGRTHQELRDEWIACGKPWHADEWIEKWNPASGIPSIPSDWLKPKEWPFE